MIASMTTLNISFYDIKFTGGKGNTYDWTLGSTYKVTHTLTLASSVSSDADTPKLFSSNSKPILVTGSSIVVQGYGYKGTLLIQPSWTGPGTKTLNTTGATVPNLPKLYVPGSTAARLFVTTGSIRFDYGLVGNQYGNFSASDVTFGCSTGTSGNTIIQGMTFKSITFNCSTVKMGTADASGTNTVITKKAVTFQNGSNLQRYSTSTETWNFQIGDGTNATGADLIFKGTGLSSSTSIVQITFNDGMAHIIDSSAATSALIPTTYFSSTTGGTVTFNTGSLIPTFNGLTTMNGVGTITFPDGIRFTSVTYTSGTTNLGSISSNYSSGTLNFGSYTVNNPSFSDVSSITGTLNTTGVVTIGGVVNGGSIDVNGTAAFVSGKGGSTIINLIGNGNLTFSGQSIDFPIVVNKPSGTVTLSGTNHFNRDFTYTTAGSFDASGSTTVFDSSSTISAGSANFNNVTFSDNGSTNVIAGTLSVLGALVLQTDLSDGHGITINGGTIAAYGSVTIARGTDGTAAISMLGASSASLYVDNLYDVGGKYLPSGTLTINKSAGATVTMTGANISLDSAQALVVTNGNLDLGGRSLTIPLTNGLTLNTGANIYRNGATLTVGGSAVGATGSYTNGGGVIF